MVYTIDEIKLRVMPIIRKYNIPAMYLFGSYAKGKATETSDVDLLIATSDSGLRFFDLVESLRESLCKKVDVLTLEQLNDNTQLLNEILKDGIRIYG